MKLDIDWIEVEDFKAYQGKHRFDLTTFADGSLHFMRGVNRLGKRLGSNGSGKSTLLCDAMTWCFFGQTASGLKNPDVKPWHFKGTTRVRVCVYRGKDKSVIARTISPNGQTINGKEAGAGDIERLLGMGLELFINTIALAQGRPLFFDLAPQGKMQLFVDALDLDRWDARAKAATDRTHDLGRLIATLDGEADGLRASLATLDDLLKVEKANADAWDVEYAERMKSAKKELSKCRAELERVTLLRDKADLDLDGAETELRALAKQFDEACERDTAARAAYCKADDEDKANRSACLTLKRKLRELGDTCEMCGQALKGSSLAKHRGQLRAAIHSHEVKVEKGISNAICNEADEAAAHLFLTRKNLLEFQRKGDTARDLLDTYSKQAAELRGTEKALSDIAARKEAEPNPFVAQRKALRKSIAQTQADLKACADDKKATEDKLVRAKFWTKGFKDIRLYVLEEIMHELELATNAMLDEAGLVGWNIKYELERETARGTTQRGLTILVASPQSEGHVKWESWSGGEAQRLRVVGALALSEVLLNHAGVEPSLEILDEPTQHLSPEGVRDLCEYLSDRAVRLNRQIWYVDQTAIESRHFASVTTITHDKGGAHVVLQGN